MKIGVFGGTFDPVHLGHIISAVEVKHTLMLDKIIFIPVQQSPHKNLPGHQKDRLNMLKYATEPYNFMHIDTFEVERETLSYTYTTMKYLTEQYPNDELYFLIGTDQYEHFSQWYKHEALLDLVHFVVMKRDEEHFHIVEPFIEARQPVIEISSSTIKSRIQNQEEYRHLLPESVYGYIKENNLYEA